MSVETDLQPDVLSGGGDGWDLKAGVAVLGDQLAGVDVVFGRELSFDSNSDAVRRASIWVGYLNLRQSVWREAVWKMRREQRDKRRRTSSPYLPFVWQSGFELFACVFGVFDVDELLVHRCRVVESGLPAVVLARHRRPDADGAPEVIGHVHRHHVLYAQAKVG